MSNYKSHILPALQQLSSPASEPVSVAYVVANSVGKSTVLVPDLWKHVKATRAGAQGLYILYNQEEAELVADHIAEREAVEVINGVPDADSPHKLGLVSFDHFNELMTGSEDPFSLLRHRDVILFADVNHIPTVSGEISIGLLVNWIKGLRSLEGVKVTIVLLACNHREDIGDIFKTYDIRITNLSWDEDIRYNEEEIETDDEIIDAILPILDEPTEGGAAPWVVIFAPRVEMTKRIIEPLNEFANQDIRYASIGREIPKSRIRAITGIDKPTILFVEDGLSNCLPLQNLRCAISLPYKRERIFDPSTSQFPVTAIPISKGDLFRQRAWLTKSAKKGGHRPTLYTMWEPEWFQANKSQDNVVVKADTMRLLLEASTMFGRAHASQGGQLPKHRRARHRARKSPRDGPMQRPNRGDEPRAAGAAEGLRGVHMDVPVPDGLLRVRAGDTAIRPSLAAARTSRRGAIARKF
ncbi:hypothetical protein F4811DRAFT_498774 [Daldinia bambusicola]|nr:hypothetical protein F4811DRAFT_498774 [Daldinia bambusicola]